MDNRIKILTTSLAKLYRRGAERNIRTIVGKTHHVDVAEALDHLPTDERVSIFQIINDNEDKASILSHLSRASQVELAHILEIKKLQELLSLMDSDDAADLLGYLPDEMSQKALSGLNKDQLQDVEELMGYPEDSAGGLMSSEFLTMNESLSVSQSIVEIQNQDEDIITFYIYVVNSNQQLVGVLSLKQLLISRKNEFLKDIMSTDVISVEVSTEQADVAQVVERYDFLSVPVVDHNQKLVGVITVDDVIDVIREEAQDDLVALGMAGASWEEPLWEHFKSRVPWLVLSILGGASCFLMLWRTLGFYEVDSILKLPLSTLPFMLLLVSTLSSQTVTMAVSILRHPSLQGSLAWRPLRKEYSIGFLLALTLVAIMTLLSVGFSAWFQVSLSLILLIGCQILAALTVSILVPLLVKRMSFNPLIAAPSVSLVLSNILAVGLLVGYYALG